MNTFNVLLQEYDYVMDEEIEFVQVLQMEGTRKEKVSTHNSFACRYHIHNNVMKNYTQN